MKRFLIATLLLTALVTFVNFEKVEAKTSEQTVVVENHIEKADGIIVDVDADNHVALVEVNGNYYEIFADDFFAGDLVEAYIDYKNPTTPSDDVICNCVYVGYLW